MKAKDHKMLIVATKCAYGDQKQPETPIRKQPAALQEAVDSSVHPDRTLGQTNLFLFQLCKGHGSELALMSHGHFVETQVQN